MSGLLSAALLAADENSTLSPILYPVHLGYCADDYSYGKLSPPVEPESVRSDASAGRRTVLDECRGVTV
ncbi:hypothetical protein OIDMADRAFT_20208 [Oidiodendron maius Zn]|uniref:Uncharacterized protein n=1 Tax=Oidiodendron maius (strain Zn) TaxID=913774 RepID=A0A0C3D739_OIDMZ|nr:hypothetical protein OIDMADRAFT_20208 [Oidiodendron maius Zn]